MKLKMLSAAVLAAMFGMLCASCGKAKDADVVTIGVSIPSADHGWTGGIVWWAEQAKKEWDGQEHY